MKVDTHAFKDAFVAGRCVGFVLHVDSHSKPPPASAAFLTQKADNHHLCLFVFEEVSAAETERANFPGSAQISIKQVSVSDIRTFCATDFGLATLVFLRDSNGAFAPLVAAILACGASILLSFRRQGREVAMHDFVWSVSGETAPYSFELENPTEREALTVVILLAQSRRTKSRLNATLLCASVPKRVPKFCPQWVDKGRNVSRWVRRETLATRG